MVIVVLASVTKGLKKYLAATMLAFTAGSGIIEPCKCPCESSQVSAPVKQIVAKLESCCSKSAPAAKAEWRPGKCNQCRDCELAPGATPIADPTEPILHSADLIQPVAPPVYETKDGYPSNVSFRTYDDRGPPDPGARPDSARAPPFKGL